MAIITKFECDKCKTIYDQDRPGMEAGFTAQPVVIRLTVKYGATKIYDHDFYADREETQVWCRPCVNGANIVAPTAKQVKAIPDVVVVPFEQRVIALLDELGFMRAE